MGVFYLCRKEKLQMLVVYLLNKYSLSHHSLNHICFKIKPEDVLYIVNGYKDILEESNIYMSSSNVFSSFTINSNDFKIDTTERSLLIESNEENFKNKFRVFINLEKVVEIEIDISCETILTFEFKELNSDLFEKISFRCDY